MHLTGVSTSSILLIPILTGCRRSIWARRSKVIIATKFGLLPWSKSLSTRGEGGAVRVPQSLEANPNDYGSSRYYIMKSVDESLRRLQTDYIDLYQIHAFDPDTPLRRPCVP